MSKTELQNFHNLDHESQKNLIERITFDEEETRNLLLLIIYLIAPRKVKDIEYSDMDKKTYSDYMTETEDLRLNQIKSLFYRFNIDVNMLNNKEIKYGNLSFSSLLNYAIFFRQEKIASYFVDQGADINYVDILGLSALNYISSIIVIGDQKSKINKINDLRDKINDKGMVSLLLKMMNHKTQKLEYFHKNPVTGYSLYDAYQTSLQPTGDSSNYDQIYKYLSNKIQELNEEVDTKETEHYAFELEEFKASFCAENTTPTFFEQYRKINKGNIFEYILAGDENGSLDYLSKNPKCVFEKDMDLQTPLHWAIFMSQSDKPHKFLNLIVELIKSGASPGQKNITGFNAIQLAGWYDYCDYAKLGIIKFTILDQVTEGINSLNNDSIESKDQIKEYHKLIGNQRDHYLNNMIMKLNKNQQIKKPNLKTIHDDQKINRLELINTKRENDDMAKEDIRQAIIIDKVSKELILNEELQKKNEINKKNSNKNKKDAKKKRDKERKLLIEAKKKAAEDQKKAEKEAFLAKQEAIKKAKEEADEIARIEAYEKAKKESDERSEQKAKKHAEKKAKRQALKAELEVKKAENEAIIQKEQFEKEIESRNKELDLEREAKIKAENDAKEAQLVAVKAGEVIDKIQKENLKAKEDYEKLKKEIEGIEKESCTSTTSEITDPESAISDNSNDECSNRPLFLSNSGCVVDSYGNIIGNIPIENYQNITPPLVPPMMQQPMIHHIPQQHMIPQMGHPMMYQEMNMVMHPMMNQPNYYYTHNNNNYVGPAFSMNKHNKHPKKEVTYANYSWPHPYQPTEAVYF